MTVGVHHLGLGWPPARLLRRLLGVLLVGGQLLRLLRLLCGVGPRQAVAGALSGEALLPLRLLLLRQVWLLVQLLRLLLRLLRLLLLLLLLLLLPLLLLMLRVV